MVIGAIAALGDLTRFDHPRKWIAYLGLVPSEHSSEPRQRKGAITKSGNSHAQRLLVEGTHSYRYVAKVSTE